MCSDDFDTTAWLTRVVVHHGPLGSSLVRRPDVRSANLRIGPFEAWLGIDGPRRFWFGWSMATARVVFAWPPYASTGGDIEEGYDETLDDLDDDLPSEELLAA